MRTNLHILAAVHPHKRGDSQTVPIGSGVRPRFTPTSVGTAGRRGRRTVAITVHPHKRGDSFMTEARYNVGYGSPPQAWGQP